MEKTRLEQESEDALKEWENAKKERSVEESKGRLFSLMMARVFLEIFVCGAFSAISISSVAYCVHEFHGYLVVTVFIATFLAVIFFMLGIVKIVMATIEARKEGLF
jgi:hypothetical protein